MPSKSSKKTAKNSAASLASAEQTKNTVVKSAQNGVSLPDKFGLMVPSGPFIQADAKSTTPKQKWKKIM